eukprot:CAMPEP_0170342656 /NCGR_PEP_ID=MMETSP0116_2-20130129/72491_1 /TAXON_ID=400756 /ORGANISM="Durinskia baltica, Strain CSIRO CS-38" /LENGTH=80 /DNA_ID=CAMNT_0010596285 /DNA_START=135 /DNA_END=374 /DNA_ORIENTATION=+
MSSTMVNGVESMMRSRGIASLFAGDSSIVEYPEVMRAKMISGASKDSLRVASGLATFAAGTSEANSSAMMPPGERRQLRT